MTRLPRPSLLCCAVALASAVVGCASGGGDPSPSGASPGLASPESNTLQPTEPVETMDPAVAALTEQVRQFGESLAGSSDGSAQPTERRPMERSPTDPGQPGISSTVAPLGQPAVAESSPRVEPTGAAEPEPWGPVPQPAPQVAQQQGFGERYVDSLRRRPHSPAAAFEHQMLKLLVGDESAGLEFTALPPEDQRVLEIASDGIEQFLDALRRDDRAASAARVAPLLRAAEKLRGEIGLVLPEVALCREVTAFGQYEAASDTFAVGQRHPVVLYVEVDNFASEQQPGGEWETRIALSAVLYDSEGQPVYSLPNTPIVDTCSRRRRDFFLCGRLVLPATTRPGPHRLKVTVRDELGKRVAQESIPVEFVAR